MPVQVFDFRWNDPQACEIQANAARKFGRKPVQIGQDLSLEIKSDVSCAGYWENDQWNSCPQNETGKSKCQICRAREGSFIFTAFDGFDQSNFTSQDLPKIQGEHMVYLALFDKDLIKVGVSQKSRGPLRQLEQGSHCTLYIAQTPDGVAARQIETLFRKSGMADKIKPSQKKDFLCPEVSESEGESILRNLFQSKKSVLSEYDHLQNFLLPDPEFKSWKEIYGLENVENSSKSFHSVELSKDEWASGKIVAIKGQFIVLETPDELVSFCVKDLYGREVEFDPKPAGLKLNTALQGALF